MSAEQKPKKYVASCSFGKDSLASVILAHEHGEPLDEIIYCEVMFSKEISGEVPEHRDFIYNTAIPKLEAWGYKVTAIRGEVTYLDSFNHLLIRGKSQGMKRGFPSFVGCSINRDCKTRPIERYWKAQIGDNVEQYVGIAIDEPERLKRLEGTNRVSLLAKYNYTEEMARKLCEDRGHPLRPGAAGKPQRRGPDPHQSAGSRQGKERRKAGVQRDGALRNRLDGRKRGLNGIF